MISFNDARHEIANLFSHIVPSHEDVPLLNSVGRIIAEDVVADIDLPLFDHSAVDGYAIVFSPGLSQWKITGTITAGKYSEIILNEQQAVSIMTGGKLPINANCVIPIEDVDIIDSNIQLHDTVTLKAGMNIRKKGEDGKQHSLIVPSYSVIHPKTVSLLASCGKTFVTVFKKLNIGVLCTGDELIDIAESPSVDKVRASNLYSLLACATNGVSQGINLGITADDPEILHARFSEVFNNNELDILVTSGGVSVGTHDFVQSVFKQLGAEIVFWKVNIKPGKPLLAALYRKRKKPLIIFGLPGNPVSSFVNYILFVQSHINTLFHQESFTTRYAKTNSVLQKKDGKRNFLRGRIEYDETNSEYRVQQLQSQSSGNMVTLHQANCLIVMKEECQRIEMGELAECIII